MLLKSKPRSAEKAKRGSRTAAKSNGIIAQALALAEMGVGIIPIPHGEKGPRTKDWQHKGTTDPESIRRIFAHGPSNYGCLMGNGFLAIDVDGEEGLEAIAESGLDLPHTRTHSTPGGGWHFVYLVPKDFKCKNAVRRLPGVDIRYAGAQIVGPGSVHPNGGVYAVEDGRAPVPLPDEWKLLLTTKKPREQPQSTGSRQVYTEGHRHEALLKHAGSCRAKGMTLEDTEASLRAFNEKFCNPPKDESALQGILKSAESWEPSQAVADLLNGERPKVFLSGDNRLTSDVATELGPHLRGDLYNHGGEVVYVERGRVHVITPQEFCTLVERYVVCCKWRKEIRTGASIQVGVTMAVEESRKLLASQQLRSQLRTLRRVATCSLPVMRADGTIELLQPGYDEATGTLTVPDVEYPSDLTIEEAVAYFTDLFSEFVFVSLRDKAVAVAAIVSLFAQQLMNPATLRPTFIYTKNAEGAGATICASLAIVTALGYVPTGTAPTENEEMRKLLTTTLREGSTVVFLDNVKSIIGCAALEAFVTSTVWSDRLLGVNESGRYDNNATVFATGNGATCSPDMRRRSLIVELLMTAERAEDKVFKRDLTINTIKALRPDIAAASWALVRHWDEQGRPGPSRSHSAFPEWARVIGGIIECAGFGCALDTPDSENARVDEDGEAMKALAEVMAETMKRRKVQDFGTHEMYRLCQDAEVFPHLVGNLAGGIPDRSKTTTLGHIFSKYNGRIVGKYRFSYAGKFRKRRFTVAGVTGGSANLANLANLSRPINDPPIKNPSQVKKVCKVSKVCKPSLNAPDRKRCKVDSTDRRNRLAQYAAQAKQVTRSSTRRATRFKEGRVA